MANARNIIAGLAAATGALALTASPAVAASATGAASPDQAQNCAIVLNKGGGVKSAHCGGTRAELAKTAQGTLLVTLFDQADQRGNYVTIYGADGGCDSAGYGIPDLSEWTGQNWNNRASSFATAHYCNKVIAHTESGYVGAADGWQKPGWSNVAAASLNSTMDDNIESLQLSRV